MCYLDLETAQKFKSTSMEVLACLGRVNRLVPESKKMSDRTVGKKKDKKVEKSYPNTLVKTSTLTRGL